MHIAILGGTGKEGRGLAYRWTRAGHTVVIGSRSLERATAAAAELNDLVAGAPAGRASDAPVSGADNPAAAAAGEVVVLAVPYEAQPPTLEAVRASLGGKVLVVTTVPIDPAARRRVRLPAAGSASAEAQQQLGDAARVVAAFQNVAYEQLTGEEPVECDVLIAGDDAAAKATVAGLVRDAGLRPWDIGPIANAVVPEALTVALININVKNKVRGAGIRITGVPPAA
jgi:NADPH-dependent F420 reductase